MSSIPQPLLPPPPLSVSENGGGEDNDSSSSSSLSEFLIYLDSVFSTVEKKQRNVVEKGNENSEEGEVQGISSLFVAASTNGCFGDHDNIVGFIKSLEGLKMVKALQCYKIVWKVTFEGESYSRVGMPECRVLDYLKTKIQKEKKYDGNDEGERGVDVEELKEALPEIAEIGINKALKNKWVVINNKTKKIELRNDSSTVVDVGSEQLKRIKESGGEEEEVKRRLVEMIEVNETPEKILQDLKKRKLLEMKRIKFYELFRGEKFSLEVKKKVADLTQDMLAKDTWKKLEFKPYNFFAAGKKPQRGSVHPLMRVMKKFKKVFISMGFEEMPTNRWVESSFWNFDALFQPQQHPARDEHDTFFLKDPPAATKSLMPNAYLERVRRMHESGGEGSIGWRYEW